MKKERGKRRERESEGEGGREGKVMDDCLAISEDEVFRFRFL
jgi:hypothetical protein